MNAVFPESFSKKKKILAISGSTRSQSTHLHLLQVISRLTVHRWEVEIYNQIGELPHFNPDVDQQGPPLEIVALRERITRADGVLFCTPEYVFSLPGALKNVLEWMVSTTVFSEKPVAILTASASGEKAHESLQLILKTLNAQTHPETALLIQGARGKVNERGEVTDTQTLQRIEALLRAFDAVLWKNSPGMIDGQTH